MARTASRPAGTAVEEQLHASNADQRQRLGDPYLVVHGERHVGALLAVPHGDGVQGHIRGTWRLGSKLCGLQCQSAFRQGS